MSVDRERLIRFLRQRQQLGEHDAFLDRLTAAEALALLRSPPVTEREPERAGSIRGGDESAPHAKPIAEREVVTGAPAVDAMPAAGSAAAEALRVLGTEAAGCTRCRLHEGRRNVVFGAGSPAAEVVVVGEAPGYQEDRTGQPFVGPAGRLLDLLLLSIGYPREQVYICNVLKCRPPRNRDPERDEVEACSAYLHRQIELIAPRVLLAMGTFAAQVLTGTDVSIGHLRGRVHDWGGTPLVATYHPAYLLRSRRSIRVAWQDLQLLREVVDA